MRRFVLARAFHAGIVCVVVMTLAFALARLAPGDPFLALEDPQMTPGELQQLRADWGYDQPVARQYFTWLTNFVTGDFGWSHTRHQPVSSVLGNAIPNTLLLMLPALVLGMIGGVALGTWQAVRRSTLAARVSDNIALTLISIPDFVIAVVVLTVFAIKLRVAPMGGMIDQVFHDSMSWPDKVMDVLAHLILPAMTLAILVAAVVSRYHRTAVVSVLHEDYIRTARAKGATEGRVIMRHALRNALGPVIVIGGLLLPAMFGGAVFIEKIFAWPGMGLALVDAVTGRDYAVVQAVVVIGTIMVTFAGTAADVIAAMVNPRTTIDA